MLPAFGIMIATFLRIAWRAGLLVVDDSQNAKFTLRKTTSKILCRQAYRPSMGSETSFGHAARQVLQEKGFIYWEDLALGDDISHMEQQRFRFWTVDGLEFCKRHVLYDTRIRSTLISLFEERCTLVHFLRYPARPGLAICFGEPSDYRPKFIVQLLSKGSRVKYYSGSHLAKLPLEDTEYNFYSTSRVALNEAGLEVEELYFGEGGGMVIFDARIRFEISQGFSIICMFAVEDSLRKWTPMLLPRLPGDAERRSLERKVEEMQSAEIGVNFVFHQPI